MKFTIHIHKCIFFSEHECILLIAQVTEYMSFLEWFIFECDQFFIMSECHICNKPFHM